MKVIKSPGPESVGGPMRGHCYNGDGYIECSFWQHWTDYPTEIRHDVCMLFGNTEKQGSEALRSCDKIYGTSYEGEA